MRKLAVALSLLLLSSHAWALDVAGVNVAPTVSVRQKTLTLNGAGIRKKLFIKVYVGSLYTERKVTTPAQLLADPGEKLIRMSFVYKKVEKEKIVEAFAEGLANNSPDRSAVRRCEGVPFLVHVRFRGGGHGGHLHLPRRHGVGDAQREGPRDGPESGVARAVLLIWFGEKPADGGLKKGMLGAVRRRPGRPWAGHLGMP